MTTEIGKVTQAIFAGTWTDQELTAINDAVQYMRGRLRQQVKGQLAQGAQVMFTGRRGVVTGTVRKVSIKYATVDTPLGGYKVPMNMLTVL
jgi:FKBP-type peptidyl-prolyl cis-trans isomerase 2